MRWPENRTIVMNEDLRKESLKDILPGRVTRGSGILNVKKVKPQISPKFYSEKQHRGIANFEIRKAEK